MPHSLISGYSSVIFRHSSSFVYMLDTSQVGPRTMVNGLVSDLFTGHTRNIPLYISGPKWTGSMKRCREPGMLPYPGRPFALQSACLPSISTRQGGANTWPTTLLKPIRHLYLRKTTARSPSHYQREAAYSNNSNNKPERGQLK